MRHIVGKGTVIRYSMKSAPVILLLSSFLTANAASPAEVRADISNGIRGDYLIWNIAGDLEGENPNILSELTWSGLTSYQLQATMKLSLPSLLIRGLFAYGWVFEGENQDSDYLGNNRTLEFSRSNNKAAGSRMTDAVLSLAFTLNLALPALRIALLTGVSFHSQLLKITDGFQTIPPTGSFPGLDSSYHARWVGGLAGFHLQLPVASKVVFEGSVAFHLAVYNAIADWNLRTDLAHPTSFDHRTTGGGLTAEGAFEISLSRRFVAVFEGLYRFWWTRAGSDRTFIAAGGTAITRLNEVNWRALQFLLGLRYIF
jgi:hypothetical protein